MNIPPPSAGYPNPLVPPPPGAPDIPPPAVEVHENDVLRRRKYFSWRNLGGDGFLVSLGFHVLLLLLGLFYVIHTQTKPQKTPGTEAFDPGVGSGNHGEKITRQDSRVQRKMTTPVKTPSRLTVKTPNAAVALPATHATTTTTFSNNLMSGDISKGSGGSYGGGNNGAGPGPGKNGKNFVSDFGWRGPGATGLPGVFYDMKQTPDRKPTRYAPANMVGAFAAEVLLPFAKKWNTSAWDAKFYKAPEQLVASQIFIPYQSAGAAPAAYGVEKEVTPSRWVVHYSGTVNAPKTGKFRFWGLCDDALVVRLGNKLALDSGWHCVTPDVKPTDTRPGPRGIPFRAGPWINFEKGHDYPIAMFLSEMPGGYFGAWLLMEEALPDSAKGDGKIFLFRMSGDALPEGLRDDTGLGVDLTGKDLIWKAKGRRSTTSVR